MDRFGFAGNSPIKKFTTKSKSLVGSNSMDQWIGRMVFDVELFIDFGYKYWLPPEISMCQTLVELKIGTGCA